MDGGAKLDRRDTEKTGRTRGLKGKVTVVSREGEIRTGVNV